jgi:hypothetical protein
VLYFIPAIEYLRSSLFWDFTQRRLVVSYQNFGTTYRSHFHFKMKNSSWTTWPLKLGPIGCHETSVTNHQSTLRKIQEERKSHLHRSGSLKSCRLIFINNLRSESIQWFYDVKLMGRTRIPKNALQLKCKEMKPIG